MAKITKTGARKPLAEGTLSLSRNHDNVSGNKSYDLFVQAADETAAGKTKFIRLTISDAELDRVIAFRERLAERDQQFASQVVT
jgi:hypothetical protein